MLFYLVQVLIPKIAYNPQNLNVPVKAITTAATHKIIANVPVVTLNKLSNTKTAAIPNLMILSVVPTLVFMIHP